MVAIDYKCFSANLLLKLKSHLKLPLFLLSHFIGLVNYTASKLKELQEQPKSNEILLTKRKLKTDLIFHR